MHQVIQEASAKGVTFIAAAGNEHTTDAVYPAAYKEVTAATARDSSGNIAVYANYANYVSVAAPGSMLFTYNGQNYVVQGTSVSSAFTSGLIAAIAEINKKTVADANQQVRNLLPAKKP